MLLGFSVLVHGVFAVAMATKWQACCAPALLPGPQLERSDEQQGGTPPCDVNGAVDL